MNKYNELSYLLEASNPRASFARYVKGGIGALIGNVTKQSYGQHRSRQGGQGPSASSYATSAGIPIASFLYQMYKMNKARCQKSCRDDKCFGVCYARNIDSMLMRIKSDMAAVGRIKDPAMKNRLTSKLQKEYQKYSSKRQNLGK